MQRAIWPAYLVLLVVDEVYLWVGFFHQTHRVVPTSTLVINDAQGIFFAIVAVLYIAWRRASVTRLMMLLVWSGLTLVIDFAYFYWGRGTRINFTTPLTHLDAVYFALGTLTTAGTGSIAATSESSRGLQSVQMALGFVLVLLAVGVVVGRITAMWSSRTEHAPNHRG